MRVSVDKAVNDLSHDVACVHCIIFAKLSYVIFTYDIIARYFCASKPFKKIFFTKQQKNKKKVLTSVFKDDIMSFVARRAGDDRLSLEN
jgi:hypothetical protein